jgi:hypothetical protein
METDYQVIKTQPRIKPTTNGQTSLPIVPGSRVEPKSNPERMNRSDWMQTHTGTRGEMAVHGRAAGTVLIDSWAD